MQSWLCLNIYLIQYIENWVQNIKCQVYSYPFFNPSLAGGIEHWNEQNFALGLIKVLWNSGRYDCFKW